MINKITKTQKNILISKQKEYIAKMLNCNAEYDIDEIINGINFLYDLCGYENPKIIICPSPLNMCIKAKLKNGSFDYFGYAYDCAWVSFYDVMECLGVKYNNDKFTKFKNFITKSGVFCTLLYQNVAFVSIMPKTCKKNDRGLHCENGPAIEFVDGYSIYALNGIIVPKEIVMTPAEQLDPNLILNEQNVDIQREIIKKIGADIVLKKLNAKILDSWVDPNTTCKYDLMQLKAGELNRIYLYYEHASIQGYFYAMPVPPECRKAMHARAWILGLIERNELNNISLKKESEIINNLPKQLS